MDKDKALQTLTQFRKDNEQRYGILSLGLFGSTAKGEATEQSDVDVVVSLKHPNLFTLSRMRIDLEERLHQPVDLVSYRERMNPFLKERIQHEGCYV
jgi:predicted nucleotidyltransferase